MSDQQKYADYVAYQNYAAAQGTGPKVPEPEPSLLDQVKALGHEAMDAKTAFDNHLLKSVSLGYLDSSKLPGGAYVTEAEKKHPVAGLAGDVYGNLGSGAAFGKAAGLLTKGKELGAVARVLRGTGAAAAEGYARNPAPTESRASNALKAAMWASGLGSVAEGVGKSGGALRYLGQKLTGMTKDEAQAYAQNPAMSEELAQNLKDAPEKLTGQIKRMLRGSKASGQKEAGALEQIVENTVKPLRAQKLAAGQGSSVLVDPGLFEGSETKPILDEMLTKKTPYGMITDTSRYTPDGQVRLSFEEADQLTRKAQEAARYKDRLAQSGQLKFDAINGNEGKVANALRSQMETNPKVAQLNESLHEALKQKEAAEQLGGNLSRLLSPSEALGSAPVRGLRSFIDQNAGTNLRLMAQQTAAGTKALPPGLAESAIDMARRTGGSGLIRKSEALRTAMSDPSLSPALASLLYGVSP